jgi:multisubunit Na+/H+ antiporter MnhE subunit
MINIFNLFLTLFFFWILFGYSNDSISPFYISFGFLSSALVSFIAWKMKIITKYSHFLFLHIGFYKHFIGIVFFSFISSLLIIFRAAIASPKINPKIYFLPTQKNINKNELVLLASTINLLPGTVFIGLEDKKIIVCSLNESYIAKLNLEKICQNLDKINDNRLV